MLGLNTRHLASYKRMMILSLPYVMSGSEEQKVVGFIHQSSGLIKKGDNFNFTVSYIRFRGAEGGRVYTPIIWPHRKG